jgi:catechol 2,3-dioxygenase-like lactoylglutathione lyase family enzyme
MFKELNHVGFITEHIGESKRLYEALGGVLLYEGVDGDGSQYTYIQIAQSMIELICPGSGWDSPVGWAHIAFLLEPEQDFSEACARLVAKGFRPVIGKPYDGRELAFFNDAANVCFELLKRDDVPKLRNKSNPLLRAFNYVSIAATAEAAKTCDAFYTKDVGFTRKTMRDTPYGRKTVYIHGLDAVQITETPDLEALKKPINHISIAVPDCDEAFERLRANNIKCGKIRPYPEGYKLFDAFGADGEVVVITDRLARTDL